MPKTTNRKTCSNSPMGRAGTPLRTGVAVVFLSAGYGPLSAHRAQADPSLECSVVSSSQVETGNCLAADEERVEKAIGAATDVRRRTAEQIDKINGRTEAVPALEAAQAAWTAYRDAQCDFIGTTFGGGSGTGIGIRSCRVAMGRARIDELLDF